MGFDAFGLPEMCIRDSVKGVKKVVNNYFVGTKKEQEFIDFYSFFFCIEQKVHPHVHL